MNDPGHVNAVPPSAGILLLIAVVAGGVGLLLSSQASLGVSVVGFGCLLAIWARIAQAAGHHRDVMHRLGTPVGSKATTPLPSTTAGQLSNRTALIALLIIGFLIGLAFFIAWAEKYLAATS